MRRVGFPGVLGTVGADGACKTCQTSNHAYTMHSLCNLGYISRALVAWPVHLNPTEQKGQPPPSHISLDTSIFLPRAPEQTISLTTSIGMSRSMPSLYVSFGLSANGRTLRTGTCMPLAELDRPPAKLDRAATKTRPGDGKTRPTSRQH